MQASGRLRRIVWSSIATLLLIGAIWIVATALLARREAQRVEAELRQIETLVASGNIPQAQYVASGIPAHAARAHSLTTGPAWWLGSHVPYLGRPLEIVR